MSIGQLREPDVRQFINDLTEEMADHLDTLIDALKRYREVGKLFLRIGGGNKIKRKVC